MNIFQRLFGKPKKSPDPPPTPIPYSKISLVGNAVSRQQVQDYLASFVFNDGSKYGRLYVGQIDQLCPDCQIIIQGEDCGQVYSIGYNLENVNIAVVTEKGYRLIKREFDKKPPRPLMPSP